MRSPEHSALRIGFVTGDFPVVTQTFIINQIADLRAAGIDVQVFAFGGGQHDNIASKFKDLKMPGQTHYISPPRSKIARLLRAIPLFVRLLSRNPTLAISTVNPLQHGVKALSLQVLYAAATFSNHPVDVFHCHFGDNGKRFAALRACLGLTQPFVTTFYGVDVSKVFAEEAPDYYDELKRTCSQYFVMSADMRRRVVEYGFPKEKVIVHPVSIDVESYPFRARRLDAGQQTELVSVGRMVEKKGFDDLLKALAIVRLKTDHPFRCTIVGDGPLGSQMRELAGSLALNDIVHFAGSMQSEEIIRLFARMHLMVQSSKTARDGDRE